MTIQQAGKNLSGELSAIYNSREAGNISRMVMEKITGLTNTERLVNKESSLTASQQDQLQNFAKQLLQHKPVQYVLNEAWFAGMRFYVDEHVLIPRPETEELVEVVVADAYPNLNLSILDIGTGSGCIAISLKKKLPVSNIYGLDISDKALAISQKNAISNEVNIEFLKADILNIEPGSNFPLFDIIISNPPYIKQSEADEMLPNVLLYEPHEALFVPTDDALLFYRSIADFSLENLNPREGKLYFEINEKMSDQVIKLLTQKGFSKISVKKDLQGKDRVVSSVLNKR